MKKIEKHYLYNSSIGELKFFVKFLEDNEVKDRKRFFNYSIKLAEYNIERWGKELSSIK